MKTPSKKVYINIITKIKKWLLAGTDNDIPISGIGIPSKYVNYLLCFGCEYHNKYEPIYYDTVFS